MIYSTPAVCVLHGSACSNTFQLSWSVGDIVFRYFIVIMKSCNAEIGMLF